LPDGLPGGLYLLEVTPENGRKMMRRFVLDE